MSHSERRGIVAANSPGQSFETSSRFLPLFTSPVVYRNNNGGSRGSTSPQEPSTPSESPERIMLNEGMFYMRPPSNRLSFQMDTEESRDDVSKSNASVGSQKDVIADAMGFSSQSRVFQLSSTNSSPRNNTSNGSLDLAGHLMTSPSSKNVRRFLAASPSSYPSTPKKKPIRLTKPDHNLEAPGLKDDFYCNVVSWSRMTNRIAVGLNNSVYSWSTDNDVVLMHHDNYVSVTSVSYSNHDYVVVGKANGELLIISQRENIAKATYSNQGKSIYCFQWFPDSKRFLAGDAKGDVLYFKIVEDSSGNVNLTLNCTLQCHQQQVCGLALTNDCKILAVGGNDNCCSIWDISNVSSPKIKVILPHKAAVKAIAFCPWANAILATGGGSNDRNIRFWHASTGTLLNTFPAKAQVTSLFWCKDRKEIISTFGYGNSENPLLLSVYSYPDMTPLVEVSSNTYLRCLSACQSPDSNSICVAANDSFIRIYKIWHSTDGLALSPGSRSEGIYGSSLIEMYEGITRTDIIR